MSIALILILRHNYSYCSLLVSILAAFATQIASKRREYVQSSLGFPYKSIVKKKEKQPI